MRKPSGYFHKKRGGDFTKKKWLTIGCAIVVFLAALSLTLYPLISNWYNTQHQSEIHTQYMEVMEQADDTTLNDARSQAIAYNKAIIPGTQLGDAFSREALLQAAEEYEQQLNIAGDGIMGYVEIPILDVSLPIFHGTDSDALDAGAGHLLGSSLPVGGESTHSVITAHSGVATQKLFSDLDKLELGDVFFLQVLGETLAYQVDEINVVLPHDTSFLGVTEGADQCTLITCTPFAVNTHRLLVRGSRIPYTEAEDIVQEQIAEDDIPASTWEQQYVKGLLIGVGAVVVTTILLLYLKSKRRGRYEA